MMQTVLPGQADRHRLPRKLLLPRQHQVQFRERLFARLDGAAGAIVWITSPAGAGKTTLAASYLGDRRLPFVWYELDDSDGDPATLFYFLGQGALRHQVVLPPLTPDLADDVPRFAAVFFRDLFAGLPPDAVVVFDNAQEVAWTLFGPLFESAVQALPPGMTLLVLSRGPAPEGLAAAGRLVCIGWDELKFTPDEALELASVQGEASEAVRRSIEETDGWAAGIALLREHLRSPQPAEAIKLLDGRDAVFRFFAGEIFRRFPRQARDDLVLLSCFKAMSAAEAEALTGNPAVGDFLAQLYQQRMFVDRRDDAGPSYQFHALFLAFLRRQFQQFDRERQLQAMRRAAEILDHGERIEEAVGLYCEVQDHGRLAALLERSAPVLLAVGRGALWREWCSRIPEPVLARHPWLHYWTGVSWHHLNPAAARAALAKADTAFAAAGDTQGHLRCVAALVDSYYYETDDFRALPALIDQLSAGLAQLDERACEPTVLLVLYSRLLVAMLLAQPDSPGFAACRERTAQLIGLAADPVERLAAGSILLNCNSWGDPAPVPDALIDELNVLAANAATAPFFRAWWLERYAFHLLESGRRDQGERVAAEARQLALQYGSETMAFSLWGTEVIALMTAGNLEAARRSLDHMRALMRPSRRLDFVYYELAESMWHSIAGDMPAAVRAGRRAVEIGVERGLAVAHRALVMGRLGILLAAAGEFEESRRWMQQAIDESPKLRLPFNLDNRDFVAAYEALEQGDEPQGIALLQGPLTRSAGRNAPLFPSSPKIAARLCQGALRAGIVPDYIKAVVQRQRLGSPDLHAAEWPWPCAVCVLGPLRLLRGGEPVASRGKAQHRPLALLRALAAAGEDGAERSLLAAELWPDADGSNAKSSLDVALHRLRKLVEVEHAIVVAGGRVLLDAAVVWTDVAALRRLCDDVQTLSTATPAGTLRKWAAALLGLYQGPLCPEDDGTWIQSAREAAQARFLMAVGSLAEELERRRDWEKAVRLYRRAGAIEPLAEAFYRGLMRCHFELGDRTACAEAFQRCQRQLSIVLGIKPSDETLRLASLCGVPGLPP